MKFGDNIANTLSRQASALRSSTEEREKLIEILDQATKRIEGFCANQSETPESLEPPSRRTYCWLKFLSIEENLNAHLAALALAAEAAKELKSDRPTHIVLTRLHPYWRRRDYSDDVVFKVNEGFLNADMAVWRALIQTTLPNTARENADLVRQYAASEDYAGVIFEMDSFVGAAAASTKGHVYDLDEVFARVNAAYFENRMAKPKLAWNRTLTARKFAHYQPAHDALMFSLSLDDPRVPAYAIDFVMYHELLHKKHGIKLINGRRVSHSSEFAADERLYPMFEEAETWLKGLATRNRGEAEQEEDEEGEGNDEYEE